MTADYRIAVPSYERADTVQQRTLGFLTEHNIDRERITVWVANEQQHHDYRQQLGRSWDIRVSAPGLLASRCQYHTEYPEGTPIANMDDDINDLLVSDGKRLRPYRGSLDTFITTAFRTAESNGCRLWGVNGAANAMYLKQQVTIGLRYTIGAFFGSYAGDPIFDPTKRELASSGEDFETALLAFQRDGAVMRYDGITIKTAYFAPGGIDAELKAAGINERHAEHERRLHEIAAAFPGLAKAYKKAGGVTNLRLKPLTAHRIPWHPNL